MAKERVKNELKGLLISKLISIGEIAELLDRDYKTVMKKLNGDIKFTTRDIDILKKKLNIPDSKVYQYFF